MIKRIVLVVVSTFLSSIISAQHSNIQKKILKLKSERMESGYDTWNTCYIDGMLDTRSLTDSVYGYSIEIPNGHEMVNYQINEYNVSRFEPNPEKSKSKIVLEIWAQKASEQSLEEIFDHEIEMHLNNNMGLRIGRIGTEKINENNTYWLESYHKRPDLKSYWEVSFYSQQSDSKTIVIVRLQSFKKSDYKKDFCLFGQLPRSLNFK